MEGLPPTQGHNPSLNARFCHQEAGSSVIKIGKRLGAGSSLIKIGKELVATRKLDLPLIKIGKVRIRDLTGDTRFPEVDHLGQATTSPFPKWIISDKRLPASSWNAHQLL